MIIFPSNNYLLKKHRTNIQKRANLNLKKWAVSRTKDLNPENIIKQPDPKIERAISHLHSKDTGNALDIINPKIKQNTTQYVEMDKVINIAMHQQDNSTRKNRRLIKSANVCQLKGDMKLSYRHGPGNKNPIPKKYSKTNITEATKCNNGIIEDLVCRSLGMCSFNESSDNGCSHNFQIHDDKLMETKSNCSSIDNNQLIQELNDCKVADVLLPNGNKNDFGSRVDEINT